MIFKPKINKVLQTLSISAIAILTALSLNTIQTHADEDIDVSGWAESLLVDSFGSSNTGGNDTIQHGVWHTKTGYLCYLLDKSGNAVPGTNAIALQSPGYYEHEGAQWVAKSRKGNYVAGTWGGVAPWNLTPWQEAQGGYAATNEPEIRAYFEQMNGDVQNAFVFVEDNWGEEMMHKFGQEECYLVIETMMHFQYSTKGNATSNALSDAAKRAKLDNLVQNYELMTQTQLMTEYAVSGSPGAIDTVREYNKLMTRFKENGDSLAYLRAKDLAEAIRSVLIAELKFQFGKMMQAQEEAGESGTRVFVGDPVIGTVPNLIQYRNSLGGNLPVFNSYTNKVAPFAEMIRQGDIGSQIGFLPWSGDTSNQITDSDVLNYGVAMMVISAKPAGQTTCDESKLPAPHAAPKESEGNVSIIKSYRTKQGTKYTDDGTHTLNNVSSQITIENEKLYQVVGWAISSSTSPTSSINWNPPSVLKKGTTPSTVNLDPTKGEIGLYLLLEKQEKEPQKLEDYNYLLTQSTITRRVFFSKPDYPLTNMNNPYIYNHPFRWSIPAHQTSCPGNHPFSDDCKGDHDGPHESSCKLTACSSTCTSTHPASGGEHVTEADLWYILNYEYHSMEKSRKSAGLR